MKKLFAIIISFLMVFVALAEDHRLLGVQLGYNGKYGYVNQKGRYLIRPIYDNARQFRQDFAAVEINGKWGFIDKRGRSLVKCQFTSVMDFNRGYAIVKMGDKWGAVNTKGELEIPCEYDRHEDLLNLKVIQLTPEQVEMLKKLGL